MSMVPENIRKEIYRRVQADLQPPKWLLHAKVGSSVAIGGFGSMFFCGQMGIGLSGLAHRVQEMLMTSGGYVGCTILCGVIFAIAPLVAKNSAFRSERQ